MNRLGSGRTRPRAWFSGLDGLRALAVAAVVTFHFAPTVLPGGFLGVDLFFVISGYLITRLLLEELTRTGRISLREFYGRRVRRLFPAVLMLLAVLVVACTLFWRDELATLRGAVASSLTYVTNWWLIGDHQSYFVSTGRPSMLQHLWSLAIEEQFYLFWPAVLSLITIAYTRRRARRAPEEQGEIVTSGLVTWVAAIAGLLAIGSAIDMALISIASDIPYGADSGRVYFGTDTHAMGLLLGAAAGALAARTTLARPRPGARRQRIVAFTRRLPLFRGAVYSDLVALGALAALVRITLTVDEYKPWLYRGGFLLIAALGAVLVSAAPRYLSLIPWAMEWAPIRWLGTRSYSVYLWHWPVAVVTRPDLDVSLHGWALFLLRCTVTGLLAEASYRMVERPFRIAGWLGLRNAWGWHRLSSRGRRNLVPLYGAGAALVLGCLVATFVHGGRGTTTSVSALASVVTETEADGPASEAPNVPRDQSASALGEQHPTSPATSPAPAAGAKPRPKPTVRPSVKPKPQPSVSAFGDSVMLGAAPEMHAVLPRLTVSAIEGRQARDVYNDIAARRAAHTLGDVVVIHAGDNGIISPSDLTNTLRSLADRQRIVVINDRVPRDWEAPNNATLKRIVPKFHNAVLVDWNGLSGSHRDWFYSDGLHLVPSGQKAFAAAVLKAIG